MNRIVISTLFAISLALPTSSAFAGPPAIEDMDPQDDGYRKAARTSGKEDRKENRKRNTPLHFLTKNERDRIEKTSRIIVPMEPIEKSTVSREFAQLCGVVEESEATVVRSVASENFLNASWPEEIFQLVSDDKKASGGGSARGSIEELESEFAVLCGRVAGQELDDEDVEFLRQLFRSDGRNLSLLIELIRNKSADIGSTLRTVSGAGQGVSPSVLGSVSSIAFEGLAEFLIDRAKEEVLTFIEDEFIDKICKADPGVFIPMTCDAIERLDAKMAISAMGAALHAAAVADLENLPDKLLVLAWQKKAEVAYPATVVRVMLPMLTSAKPKANPLEYVASIYRAGPLDCEDSGVEKDAAVKEEEGDEECKETMAWLRLSSVFLRATLENSGPAGELLALDYAPYVALGIAFRAEALIGEMPTGNREKLRKYTDSRMWKGDHFQLDAKSLDGVVTSLSHGYRMGVKFHELRTKLETSVHMGATIDMVPIVQESAEALVEIFKGLKPFMAAPEHEKTDAGIVESLENIDTTLEIASAVRHEDWGQAIIALLDLTKRIVEDTQSVDPQTLQPKDELAGDFEVLGRYLLLLAEIGNAESSADVNATLQAAFPAGGYRRKFVERSIAINGFLGVYSGGVVHSALLSDDDVDALGAKSPEFAMFAPVGLHMTWPIAIARPRPSNVGILASVIDLGSITTSKWTEDEINPARSTVDDMGMDDMGTVQTKITEPAAINFAGIVAPGAHLTFGIARSPFVIGAGASISPFAQKRTNTERDSNGDIESTDGKYLAAVRFGVFLAVDITFVSFGIGPKRR